MPIWRTRPVEQIPKIEMASWMFIRTELDVVHHVGRNVTEDEGRVSSRVVSFDVNTRVAVTHTGRRYRLIGEPGSDADSDHVFAAWCAANTVLAWNGVTAQVLASGISNACEGLRP